MGNEFRGYSLFNDVENKTLKAFNRATVALNINKDAGVRLLEQYLMHFNKGDRNAIHVMLLSMRKFGADVVRRKVHKEVEHV